MKKTLLLCLSVFCITLTAYSQTTFAAKVSANSSANPYVMDSGELSGDAYPDIVIGTFANRIEWYKFDITTKTFILQPTAISTTMTGPSGIHIADVNGDTYNDIIAASYDDDSMIWYSNDGTGNFTEESTISTSILGAGAIVTGNIDNDVSGTLDVAVVAYDSGDTVWFSNNGSGVFTGPNPIASGTGAGDLDIADFDGDGDLDFVIAYTGSDNVEIYDNDLIPGGSVAFNVYTNSVSTGNDYLFDIGFADVNDDGNLDVIKADTGNSGTGDVSYIIADDLPTDGINTTFTEVTVSTGTSIARPASAAVADLDGDTYNDIVSSNSGTAGDDLEWFESPNPPGTTYTDYPMTGTQSFVYSITLGDFDNDGDVDVASLDYGNSDLNWFENELITLSLGESTIETINMFPNPTKDKLNFRGLSDNTFEVSVYDILGKNVLNASIEANSSLDVSQLTGGVYIIKFNNSNQTFKFVKE